MARHVVCTESELPPGSVRMVKVGPRAIGVLNVNGRYYAIRDICPHQGAPLCQGSVGGTMLPSEPHEYVYGMDHQVIRCPWHGWEFDLETGRSLFNPDKVWVKTYPVRAEDGLVILEA